MLAGSQNRQIEGWLTADSSTSKTKQGDPHPTQTPTPGSRKHI